MCGIAGYLMCGGFEEDRGRAIVRFMTDSLTHRGPDDSGLWVDGRCGIALGHRRLSIIDLSSAGRQPMMSESGRYIIVFNGEIYNHLPLREEIEDVRWRGHSDTETLLSAIDKWGIERALEKSVGMFALAVWDRHESKLFLARDRIGEKPLYYGWQKDVFLFGSELKALRAFPGFATDVDEDALLSLLQYGYIRGPASIYRHIRKVAPGEIVRVGARNSGHTSSSRYWSYERVIEERAGTFRGGIEDATAELEVLITEAIRGQRVADVPLGAFLSGGVDSSLVVATMQAQMVDRVRTFTVGFEEREHNEADVASAVAKHLGTRHTEVRISASEAMGLLPAVPAIYDEPLADSSQLPTILVSKVARQQVKVALSGDGGDELFGGYPQYVLHPKILRRLNTLGRVASVAFGCAVKLFTEPVVNSLLESCLRAYGRSPRVPPTMRVHQIINGLSAGDELDFSSALAANWIDPHRVLATGRRLVTRNSKRPLVAIGREMAVRMMVNDVMGYLPDDILVKVDRASMSVSLETRAPLLDHRIVEFAASLPLNLKIENGRGKYVLRRLLSKYVPDDIVSRPKQGFTVPISAWLRVAPLRDWAESLLSEQRLREEGFFDPTIIRARWSQHVSGRYDWGSSLWGVLAFQAWLETERRTRRTLSSVAA